MARRYRGAAAPVIICAGCAPCREPPRGSDPDETTAHGGPLTMKYMVMIYDNAATRELFLGEDGKDLMAEIEALMAELTESGELVGGEALGDPSNTKTIRLVDGVPAVTDGPLAEAKEHFGGYLMLECESIERAADIARRWPSARFRPLEVRPLMSADGAEM